MCVEMLEIFGIDLTILQWLGEFLLLPIIVIYLYDFVNFLKCFNNLCDEIDENHSKIQTTEINKQLKRMETIWNRQIENSHPFEWVGFAKRISIWILSEKNDTDGTDYYRYLPSDELKNFIRQGFYRFIKDHEESLTLFYVYCEGFSVKEQNIEKIVNNKMRNAEYRYKPFADKKLFFDNKIEQIRFQSITYLPGISDRYNEIHPFFKKGLIYVIPLYLSKNILIEKLRKIRMELPRAFKGMVGLLIFVGIVFGATLLYFGILNHFFPSAPPWMTLAATSFFAAISGGLVAERLTRLEL